MATFSGEIDNELSQNQLNDSRNNDSHSGTTQVDPQVIFQPKIEKVLREDIKFYDLKDDNFEVEFFAQTIYSKIEKANDKDTQKIDVEVQKLIENRQDLKNQIKNILENKILCRNSDINCKFEGNYDEIKKHLKNDCDYEFTEFNNEMVMNIALKKIREQRSYERKSSTCQNDDNQQQQQPQQQQQQQSNQNCNYQASHNSRKQSTNSLFNQQQNSREERTLLVANFPKIGMVELFKKFGELDYFSFQKNDKNLIFFSKFSRLENAQRALDQLDQTEISGRKLRVTFFRPKQDLWKFRVFVKGLQTNDAEAIKTFLQGLIDKSLSQVSLLNQYSEDRDASAFVQVFEEEDAEKLKKYGVLANTKIGKKVQFCEYRQKSNNSHAEMGGGASTSNSGSSANNGNSGGQSSQGLGLKSNSGNNGNNNNNNNHNNHHGHHHNHHNHHNNGQMNGHNKYNNNQNNGNNYNNNNYSNNRMKNNGNYNNHNDGNYNQNNHNNHNHHHHNHNNNHYNNNHYHKNYNNNNNHYHKNNNYHHNNKNYNNNNGGGNRNGYQHRHKGSHHIIGGHKNYNNNGNQNYYQQKNNHYMNNKNNNNNNNNNNYYISKQQSQPNPMQQHQQHQQQQGISQFEPFSMKPQVGRDRVQSTSAMDTRYMQQQQQNDIQKIYPPNNNRQNLEGQENRVGFLPTTLPPPPSNQQNLQGNGSLGGVIGEDDLFSIFQAKNSLNPNFYSSSNNNSTQHGNGFPVDLNQNLGGGFSQQSQFQFVQPNQQENNNGSSNESSSKDFQNIMGKYDY